MYLPLKFLHIFFIVAWFAGLFYLPRIFVNLANAQNEAEYERLLGMARRLYKFMTPWGIGALIFGIAIPYFSFGYAGWVHAKITIGILLLVYHFWCRSLLIQFENKQNKHSHKWFRVFNELPVFALLIAIYLALYKPF